MDLRLRDPSSPLRTAAPVAASLLLAMWGSAARDLWVDEGFSIRIASLPWAELPFSDPRNPPFFYALLKLWLMVSGTEEAWARLLPASFAAGSVLALRLCASRWWGPGAAEWAAWLLALSPLHRFHSQNLRAYALLSLLSVLSFHALWKALRAPSPRRWVAWSATAVLLLYSHTLSALLLAAQGAWTLWTLRGGRALLTPLGAAALALLAYLPWLPHLAGAAAEGLTGGLPRWADLLLTSGAFLNVEPLLGNFVTPGDAALLAVAALFFWTVLRFPLPPGDPARALAAVAGTGLALHFLAGAFFPLSWGSHHKILYLPLFLAWAGASAFRAEKKARLAFLAFFLASSAAGWLRQNRTSLAYTRETARFLREGGPGPLACLPDWVCSPLRLYLERWGVDMQYPPMGGEAPRWIVLWRGPAPPSTQFKAQLMAFKKRHGLVLRDGRKIGTEFIVLETAPGGNAP